MACPGFCSVCDLRCCNCTKVCMVITLDNAVAGFFNICALQPSSGAACSVIEPLHCYCSAMHLFSSLMFNGNEIC